MSRISFGAYEPDKAAFQTDALVDMANAYPSANGYRPVGQFKTITDPLPTPFNGGSAFVASDENGTLLAGSSTNLYKFSGGSWTSLIDGLTIIQRWQFTQFGDAVICVNGSTTQQVDLLAGSAGELSGAPTATSVATVRDFVVYGGANGNASLIQWSAFNNQNGNTPGTDQAGYQPMLDGGDVMGVCGGEYGLIVQRSAIRRMTYTGDDYVWQFDVIAPNVGAMVRGSIAQSGRQVFFLSDRGFMSCDGNAVSSIGAERIDATFFATHGRADLSGIFTAIDPRRTIVAWIVPGSPARIWLYNWTLDRWAVIKINAKAIFSGFTTNITLEQLDALYPDGLESIPYSLDDPRFSGGDPLLLIVDGADQVGQLIGDNMSASFTTGFVEMIDGRRSRLRFMRPVTDAIAGVTMQMDCRQRLGDPKGAVSNGSMQPSGDIPVRASGRYIAVTQAHDAGSVWSFSQGFEPVFAAGGGR